MFNVNQWMDYSPEEVCTMLTIKAYPKHLIPRLELDDAIRADITNRLQEVGYEFIDDPISQHFDARLSQDIRHHFHLMRGRRLLVRHYL